MKRTRWVVAALMLLVLSIAFVDAWADGESRAVSVRIPDSGKRDTRIVDHGAALTISIDGLGLVVRDQIVAGWARAAADEWVAATIEAQRVEDEARAAAAARARAPAATFTGPAGSGDCANPIVPEAIARRESGCSWSAYNASGCYNRGCLGFYQLDAGHFYAVSPWNSNVSGSCYGLDPSTQAGQTECASRLDPSTAWR